MAKQMYINVVNAEESRIAILADGRLEALAIETAHHEMIEGNIYKGRIDKIMPSLDAVFVEYGREKNGFLAMSEIRAEYFAGGQRSADKLKRGQDLLIQVKKGEIGEKGAALTTYVSLPGRYLVLMPYVDKRGVSRQIQEDDARKEARAVIEGAGIPEEMGYIVRTAASGQKKQDIQRDISYLLRLWKRIQSLYKKAKAPGLLLRESDVVTRTIRDYFTPEIEEVLIDDARVFEQVKSFFKALMPYHAKKVRLYEGKAPLFTKHNLDTQIESVYEDKVKLPSGGSIVIQQTEALVSVDVNSGAGSQTRDIEQTALQANLEAAAETARQLKLRDMGGLIVIDFIDMRSSSHRSQVKKELQKALKVDKARTDVGTISKFGLLELSRQRLKGAAVPRIMRTCPVCGGSGRLRGTENFALSVLRIIQGVLARAKRPRRLAVGVPPEAAAFLFNRKRAQIAELEDDFGVPLSIFAEPELPPNRYYLECVQEDKTRVETDLPSDFPTDRLGLRKSGAPMATSVSAPPPAAAAAEAPPHWEEEEEEIGEEGEAEETAEAGEAAAEEGNGGKKRRRRRRRGKKKGAGAEVSVPGEAPETEPEAIGEVALVAEEREEAGEEEIRAGEEPPEVSEGAGKKRRRRRRRSKKKVAGSSEEIEGKAPEGEAEAERAATAEAGETEAEGPEPAEEAASDSEGAGKKRRRRRSRKKAAVSAESPAPAPAEAAAPELPAPAEAAAPESSAPPAEAKPTGRRRSRGGRTRKKAETAAE